MINQNAQVDNQMTRPRNIVAGLAQKTQQVLQRPKQIVQGLASGVKSHLSQAPIGQMMQGNFQQAGAQLSQTFGSPEFITGFVGGLKPKFPKMIDNFTKDEMIQAIDYIRLKQPYSQKMEESIGYLADKFGGSKTMGGIANRFQQLVERTKTRDISSRKPLWKVESLKKPQYTKDTRGRFTGSEKADPLINEARKYKSAEEFVKAQGETITLYRAAPKFPADKFTKGTYFADEAGKARYYSESHYKGDPSDIKVEKFTVPKNTVFREPSTGNYITTDEAPILKTRSQLTELWNKAKGKK